MSRFSHHPTDEQLQAFVDDRRSAPDVRSHLESCARCRELLRIITRLEHALKALPLERTGEQFTEKVVDRLAAGPASSTLFRLLGGIASLVGLVVVLGVMIGVFLFTGVIDMGQVTEGGTKVQQVMQQVGGTISEQIAWFNALLRTYLPFAFGKGSIGITLFVLLVASGLAIADRLLGRRYSPR